MFHSSADGWHLEKPIWARMWVQPCRLYLWQYNLLFAILILIFTFFYTAITVPSDDIADNLKEMAVCSGH